MTLFLMEQIRGTCRSEEAEYAGPARARLGHKPRQTMSTNGSHRWKGMIFALLSFLDLLLTRRLVRPGSDFLYESNPIAGWWLASYGWSGLIAFKLTTIGLALVLFGVIGARRPLLGGRILTISCLTVGGVVLYSCYLTTSNGKVLAELQAQEKLDRCLQEQLARCEANLAFQRGLTAEVIAGRCTLSAAIASLGGSPLFQEPVWRKRMCANYPGRSEEECLALFIMRQAVIVAEDDPAAATALLGRLAAEYQVRFGCGPPSLQPGPFARKDIAEPPEEAKPRLLFARQR